MSALLMSLVGVMNLIIAKQTDSSRRGRTFACAVGSPVSVIPILQAEGEDAESETDFTLLYFRDNGTEIVPTGK